jgi:hypothetical protein
VVIITGIIDQEIEVRSSKLFDSGFGVIDKSIERSNIASIQLQRDGSRPCLLHFSDDRLRVLIVAVIGKDRVNSAPCETLDRIAANAAASAGYDSYLDIGHFTLLNKYVYSMLLSR